ncbi:hypothetical protein F5X99DRAFT_367306 [Biscogniauxia marginata]|nr:hypothetical protein F5X99DRAFT_367306 [Biscogniauxia marginata]
MTSTEINEANMPLLSSSSSTSDPVLTPTSSQDQEDASVGPITHPDTVPDPGPGFPQSQGSGEWTTVIRKKRSSKTKTGPSTAKKYNRDRKEKGKKGKGDNKDNVNSGSATAAKPGNADSTPKAEKPNQGNHNDGHGKKSTHHRRSYKQRRDPDAEIQGPLPGWYKHH